MYRTIQQTVVTRLRTILRDRYDLEVEQIATEQPPDIGMGELALPIAFELAKRLRKAPRAIAAELKEELEQAIASGDLPTSAVPGSV